MFVDCIFLIKNGVPWHKVFGNSDATLSMTQRFAAAVALGELDGGSFDWSTMEWHKRS